MKGWLGYAAITMLLLIVIAIILFPFGSKEDAPAVSQEKQKEVWHLRLSHNTPVDSALHEAAQRYVDEVSRKTGGSVQIEIFPAQELGNDHQTVEMARRGELDIILTPTAKMSVAVPSMQYADLPFYFPEREDVYTMLDGEPGEMLLEHLRSIGLVGITFWENGFKHFTGNKPLLRPEDFKGLNVRVMKSRILMEQFRSFGANPVAIDFHATRQALADGVVDAQENPLIAIVTMGFHEVQSDLTLSSHGYLGYVFSISAKVLEQLPSEIRMVLTETAKEVTPWERQQTHEREKRLLETIRAAGVTIHTLEESERKRFATLTANIPKQYEGIIGSDVISKTEELLMAKYGPSPESGEQIVIALDADLSMGGWSAGLAIKRGVEMAIEEINARGGVLGKPLALIARDHRGIASKGVDNVTDFIGRPDVVAIVGGKHSAVILAEMEKIQKAGIPYLVPWAAASEVTENGYENNVIFRISANDRMAAKFIAADAVKHHKKPAIIVENSVWGRGARGYIERYLENLGITPAANIVVNRGQKDISRELEVIRQAGADVIIMVANAIEGGAVARGVASMEVPLPIVSHWGILGGSFFEENYDALKQLNLRIFQNVSFTPEKESESALYAKRYEKLYKEPLSSASFGYAHAHDLVHLLAMAIEKAGGTDRSEVRAALEQLPAYRGIVKEYAPAFTEERHDALDGSDFFMGRFAPDGTVVPAEEL